MFNSFRLENCFKIWFEYYWTFKSEKIITKRFKTVSLTYPFVALLSFSSVIISIGTPFRVHSKHQEVTKTINMMVVKVIMLHFNVAVVKLLIEASSRSKLIKLFYYQIRRHILTRVHFLRYPFSVIFFVAILVIFIVRLHPILFCIIAQALGICTQRFKLDLNLKTASSKITITRIIFNYNYTN